MRTEIHIHGPVVVNVYSPNSPDEAPTWAVDIFDALEEIIEAVGRVEVKEDIELMNLQDIQAQAEETLSEVQSESNVSQAVLGVVTHQNDVLSALQQQIKDLQSQNDPEALQKISDTIAAIKASAMSNADSVSQAVVAGTPAEEPPVDGGGDTGNESPAAGTGGA